MSWRVMVADLARPLIRRLPRGAGRVLSLIGGGPHSNIWQHAPRRARVFFDKTLQCWVSVDLAEWFGRLHYYSGRYYDRDIPHLIRTLLRPGDVFIDIGAHYGMHSLCAARHLASGGRVFSFEPNPRSFALLKAHLAINRLENVIAENAGLSDEPATLTLHWDDTNTATFLTEREAKFSATVPVFRGDDALPAFDPQLRVLIKIDTEGYEHRVIKGLPRTLSGQNVSAVVEITDGWLRKAGSSAQELIDDMKSLGFTAHSVHTRLTPGGLDVEVKPISQTPADWQYDLFFTKIPMP